MFIKSAWVTLKKIGVWLRHKWYVPGVILYTIVLWIFFRRKDGAQEVLEARNESYRKQIEAINEAHKEEIEKRNKILEKYNELASELEDKHAEDSEVLDNQKKKELKEMVEKYYDQPDELARLLAEKYDLEYVE
jgi:flagellar biosynthesis/type III secretory pathway M-ring protein FliF/YscJ